MLGNGPDPAGYHWLNLALHALNVALVYAAGVLVLGESFAGLALAAIWGLHPLLTEGVTNVIGRADLLAAFGVLLGLLCHVRASASAGGRRLRWLIALIAAQAIGLFSKESAAVLPGVMLLYDLIWPERAAWRARILSYAALAIPFAAFFAMRSRLHTHLLVLFSNNPLVGAGFWTARLTAVKVIGKLLWLFVWPARLSVDYSYNAIPLFGWRWTNGEDAKAVIALIVCAGALVFAWRMRRAQKPLAFFIAFFFVTMAPTANLFILIGSIMAERFLYLPSIGLAGCVVWTIDALVRRLPQQYAPARRAGWVAAGLLSLAFGMRTYARNTDWFDAAALWTSAVEVNPDACVSRVNLGNALMAIPGRLPDAVAQYRKALQIDPDLPEAHANLGAALSRMPGRLPEAVAELEAAVRLNPGSARAHNNLGIALLQTPGRMPAAIVEIEAALKIDPGFTDAHYALGSALAQSPGRLQQAADEFNTVLRSRPGDAKTHGSLGNVLSQMPGRLPDAIAEWEAAVAIDPGLAATHYQLGMALSRLPGHTEEAIEEFEEAGRIRPDLHIEELVNRLRAAQR